MELISFFYKERWKRKDVGATDHTHGRINTNTKHIIRIYILSAKTSNGRTIVCKSANNRLPETSLFSSA